MGDPTDSSERQRMAARLAKLMEPESPERAAERKRVGTRCGHVKRKLRLGERLEGDLLAFAVATAGGNVEIAEKLNAGERLSDYELHLMVDVYLLHAKLGA